MTTLTLAFTVPKTPDECIALGVSPMHVDSAIVYRAEIDDLCAYDVDDMGEWNTEIPVTRFLDLTHDRIVPWRLEEVGFKPIDAAHKLWLSCDWPVSGSTYVVADHLISVSDGVIELAGNRLSITTFTDLLTLIRMLTPKSND